MPYDFGRSAVAGLVLIGLSGCDSLSEWTGNKPSAEQTCSSQETYDGLTGIMAAQAGSAANLLGSNGILSTAASPAAMKNVLGYSAPTVEEANKSTRKISCQALLRITLPTSVLPQQTGLTANDFGPDHVTYAISYSVQPTADQGRPLMTLENASALSTVAFQASLVALKKGQDAAASAEPPEMEDDRGAEEPEPTPEQAEATAARVETQEAASNEAETEPLPGQPVTNQE